MLTYLKWSFWIVFWTLALAFFHYTLPQHDIVRITDTYEKRVDLGGENTLFWSQPEAGGPTDGVNRDVFFIQATDKNGKPKVYRNEDTGLWGWPPYFKITTANVQASAADLRSTSEKPVWVAVRHYGWRSTVISIYPNALSVRKVDGPDVMIMPWVSIIVFLVLGSVVWAVWSRVRRFRRNRIDPLLDDVGSGFSQASDSASGWLDSWKGPAGRR